MIDQGLAAGDVVALRDPTARRARRRGGDERRRAGAVMDVRESLGAGLESLRHHKLRSFLAMLGIIFGVGAVIAMLSIGAGAEREALEIIDAMGLRNVVVKDKRFDRENELQEIRQEERGALRARRQPPCARPCPGVERVVAKIEVEPWKVLSPAGRAKPRVLGVSAEYPELVRLHLREGRFFDALRRGDLRAGVRDRRRGAARPVRLRPALGRPREGERRVADGRRHPRPPARSSARSRA